MSDPVVRIFTIPLSSLVAIRADVAVEAYVLSVMTQVPAQEAHDIEARVSETEAWWSLSLIGPTGTLARTFQVKPTEPEPPPGPWDVLARHLDEATANKVMELLDAAGFEVTEREWPDDDYEDDP